MYNRENIYFIVTSAPIQPSICRFWSLLNNKSLLYPLIYCSGQARVKYVSYHVEKQQIVPRAEHDLVWTLCVDGEVSQHSAKTKMN